MTINPMYEASVHFIFCSICLSIILVLKKCREACFGGPLREDFDISAQLGGILMYWVQARGRQDSSLLESY